MPCSPARDHQLRQWLTELDKPAQKALPLVACADCRHFIPDKINPPAGMGDCARVLGMWHPMAPHRCVGFEEGE